MKYLLSVLMLLIFINNKDAKSEILPNDLFSSIEVVEIQMTALQSYSITNNEGIYQCWLFAHPKNKNFTGPFNSFINMISDTSYNVLLNSLNFKTKLLLEENNIAKVSVDVDAQDNKRYNLTWILEKTYLSKECINCWMTLSVTQPQFIGLLN
jgi:hypothetical protein